MLSFTATLVTVASVLSLAQAYTQPKGDPTWGPVQSPDTSSTVVRGTKFNITWDPENHATQGVTVSLVLCKGPGNNCKLEPSAIAESLPAAQKSFQWTVPCSLAAGVAKTDTGYGIALIVDGTGEHQYSTQFSVQTGDVCPSADPSSTIAPSKFSTMPLPTGTAESTFSTSKTSSVPAVTSSSTPAVTTAPSPTRSPVPASNPVVTTTTTTNGAVAKATNAAGAMFAVGLAILAV